MALPKADPRPSAPGFPALTNGCRWRRNAAFTITAADREVDASFSLPCSRGEGRLTEWTPAVRPWPQERVFVPRSCHLQRRPRVAELDVNPVCYIPQDGRGRYRARCLPTSPR